MVIIYTFYYTLLIIYYHTYVYVSHVSVNFYQVVEEYLYLYENRISDRYAEDTL